MRIVQHSVVQIACINVICSLGPLKMGPISSNHFQKCGDEVWAET